jgi:hypothetical protein
MQLSVKAPTITSNGAGRQTAMAREPVRTPTSVQLRTEPRRPEVGPKLGIDVDVDRRGTPKHRLVTVGDSITQGFMSGAVFRTELSWPAIVAYELGLSLGRPGTEFRYPTYELPDGPGGIPFDLERIARAFEERYGSSLGWTEVVSAVRWGRRYMGAIERHWEGGPGRDLPETEGPYHNLAIYGLDLLDVQLLHAGRLADRVRSAPPKDNWVKQGVQNDSAIAGLRVLDSCRTGNGDPVTALDAARAMGDEGTLEGGPGAGPGIETLVVVLGANNALGSVVELLPKWTPDTYLDWSPEQRLATKGPFNVWQPHHFAAEWADLVAELIAVKARHVIIATVPQVTIAPIARGAKGKARAGSRYFRYYTKPWITDRQFDADDDPHLVEQEARAIDSAIDAFNETIIGSVRAAREAGRDWYLFDLGISLDRMASRRYIEDPAAQPDWWTPYPLPPQLANLPVVPDTHFFRSGPNGRSHGGIFSLDGIHPTTIAYGLIAQEVISIMDTLAHVPFRSRAGDVRPTGTAAVDFGRLLAADTLLSRPPAAIDSSLSLLGWLDDLLDWTSKLAPGF